MGYSFAKFGSFIGCVSQDCDFAFGGLGVFHHDYVHSMKGIQHPTRACQDPAILLLTEWTSELEFTCCTASEIFQLRNYVALVSNCSDLIGR